MIGAAGFRGWQAAAVVLGPALVIGCTASNLDELNGQRVQGEGFNQTLAVEYRGLADFEENQMYDTLSAQRFAGKGLAAVQGREVAPENPDEWPIENAQMKAGLHEARGRLINSLAAGAAHKAPKAAAQAQVNYDCWVEQSSEGWQYTDIAACRNGFMRAMEVVERQSATPRQAESVAPQPRVEQRPVTPPVPSKYVVFFDWDKATLTAEARTILRTTAENAGKARAASVDVVGHADRSGPTSYNDGLSRRRAEAVAHALSRLGLNSREMRVQSRGERDPLVPTADGVREPQNRRVEIDLRGTGDGMGASIGTGTGARAER